MNANEKYLIRFLDSSDTNFVIPVYQRNYDWKKEQCKQLYDDLVKLIKYEYKNHFFGSVVSIYNDGGRRREYLIIDGQQRVTTISLLLLAIYNVLKEGRLIAKDIVIEKIKNQYLVNQYSSDDRKLKLKPIKDDRNAFEKLFNNEELIGESSVTINYLYFYNRILEGEISIDELYLAIEKLMIVEIELKNGEDDPQLIFESLNSTGLDLNDADKVRNFILMGQTSENQELLYNNYWNKIEKNTLYKVTEFIRDYMTMKESKISNISKTYVSFKNYINSNDISIEECLKDMLLFSKYYNFILTSNIGIPESDEVLKRLNKLEVTVSYPFLLEIIDDYTNKIISKADIVKILEIIESYVFRRLICRIPTNALNKVFMVLGKDIKKNINYKENYVDIFKYILKSKKSSQRMPDDEEFKRNFMGNDIYNMKKNKVYLLERLENYNNKEYVDVEGSIANNKLTIEHIMPQELNMIWKNELGDNYAEIHNKYLHTIGNLTLTGYNSSLSNKGFNEKKNMQNGFKYSRLRLNKYLAEINAWNEKEIVDRAEQLSVLSKEIWKYIDTEYTLDKETENLFSLSDEEDFTGSKVKQYQFMEDIIKVKDWTELYEKICFTLYDLEPAIFRKITKKKFAEESINKRFSNVKDKIRTPIKVAEDIYVEKNLSTESKLDTLRKIFDEYDIDYSELSFSLKV